jgi:rRNA maturation endonuclease Nob1
VDDIALDFVNDFSKETGDLKTLSQTDLKVIALGVQLAKERGEESKLEKQPKPLEEFRPKRF